MRLTNHMFKYLYTPLVILLLSATSIFAQNQSGTLKGVITDTDDGQALIGVNVIIKGTQLGTATDVDGSFVIDNIPADTYNIELSYVGYEKKLFTGIEIVAGETRTLDAELAMQVLTSDEEVVIVGEKPIFDVEKSNSSVTVSSEEISSTSVDKVEDVVALQAGVVQDATGLYIKGGRAYETGYVVDGVSAQDPLAGTGFGLDIGSGSLGSVEVITGGVGASYGDVTSGVVNVKTKSGGQKYSGYFSHKRDNFGSNTSRASNFFQDTYEFNIGGPEPIAEKILKPLGADLPGNLTFFASGQVSLSDKFTKVSADQVRSSLIENTFWSPRQDNRWNGMLKLTWNVKPGMKLQASYQRSLTINQNTRMLQITGNDVSISPGYQFFFQNDLDNANTYTHKSNLSYIKWTHTLDETSYYEIQVSRLFTRLRADANGRYWRPDSVDGEFDARSIITPPVTEFPTNDDFLYVLPGSGLANNGGIASLWHDHFAEETVFKTTYTKFFADQTNRLTIGLDMKFQDYQWIDITRPWVGAPIQIAPGEFSESNRLGQTSDIWRVKPKRGALYASHQVRYKGLIATLGLRLEYWSPGSYVDDQVNNPLSPIPQQVRDGYKDDTIDLPVFGRTKARALPKLSVSFPVRENQVLFFNYGHSTRVPHPTYVYAGLDPFYQDRSFLSDLGNPNLDPEVDISYEIGLRYQITTDDALSISAFWRDKYDFITTERIILPDATGRETTRSFRVNGDYARVRGLDLVYFKRYQDWVQGQISVSYSRAEGLSSSSNDALASLIQGSESIGNNIETPLAWDRPFDIKGNITFTYDRDKPLLDVPGLNNMRLNLTSVWRSGIRYTPYTFEGFGTNPVTGQNDWRPIYERAPDPNKRYSETGEPWFWIDMKFQKWFTFGGVDWNFFVEIENLLNNTNSVIVNPVTGKAYKTNYPDSQAELIALRDDRSYDVPSNVKDPRYLDPRDNNIPAYLNPANFMKQRHIVFGLSVNF